MMGKNALIIFLKNSGEVKSRIAHEVGTTSAISIYNELLDYTFSLAKEVKAFASIYLFFTKKNDAPRWSELTDQQHIQIEGDLGERMSAAIQYVLKNYKHAVLIGSDCPYIEARHIAMAFDQLSIADVVIGPANDGGYYLIGMKNVEENIFNNIPWSTNEVYHTTIDRIYESKLSMATLEKLSDIDFLQDYQLWNSTKKLS